jgi:hypothetical protein
MYSVLGQASVQTVPLGPHALAATEDVLSLDETASELLIAAGDLLSLPLPHAALLLDIVAWDMTRLQNSLFEPESVDALAIAQRALHGHLSRPVGCYSVHAPGGCSICLDDEATELVHLACAEEHAVCRTCWLQRIQSSTAGQVRCCFCTLEAGIMVVGQLFNLAHGASASPAEAEEVERAANVWFNERRALLLTQLSHTSDRFPVACSAVRGAAAASPTATTKQTCGAVVVLKGTSCVRARRAKLFCDTLESALVLERAAVAALPLGTAAERTAATVRELQPFPLLAAYLPALPGIEVADPPIVFCPSDPIGHPFFCASCRQPDHRPALCVHLADWNFRSTSTSEKASEALIQATTKSCPHCHTAIEKNEGCFQVSCTHCRHVFCWLCLQPWRSHSNHFACPTIGNGAQLPKGLSDATDIHTSTTMDNMRMLASQSKRSSLLSVQEQDARTLATGSISAEFQRRVRQSATANPAITALAFFDHCSNMVAAFQISQPELQRMAKTSSALMIKIHPLLTELGLSPDLTFFSRALQVCVSARAYLSNMWLWLFYHASSNLQLIVHDHVCKITSLVENLQRHLLVVWDAETIVANKDSIQQQTEKIELLSTAMLAWARDL